MVLGKQALRQSCCRILRVTGPLRLRPARSGAGPHPPLLEALPRVPLGPVRMVGALAAGADPTARIDIAVCTLLAFSL